jgi:hypothetical protein
MLLHNTHAGIHEKLHFSLSAKTQSLPVQGTFKCAIFFIPHVPQAIIGEPVLGLAVEIRGSACAGSLCSQEMKKMVKNAPRYEIDVSGRCSVCVARKMMASE